MSTLNRTVTLLDLLSLHTDVPKENSSTGGGSNCGKRNGSLNDYVVGQGQ